jgi:uncharacterized protein (DUF305 family)
MIKSIRHTGLFSLVALGALLLSACASGAQSAADGGTAASPAASAGDMDHGAGHSMDMTNSNAPYDAQFIDGMIEHHRGAITMANQALQESQRTEIRALAQEIITAQEAEISQLEQWRNAWYPDLAPTGGMAMDMGPMNVPAGPEAFDQRFIQAMIPHHEGAIAMAQDALQNAERQEIKDLSQEIITAQEREIAQMRQWLKDWYGIE